MYKRFVFLIIGLILLFGPITQFVIFKFTPIYTLNLYSRLYDYAHWVKGNPKVLIMGSSHARYHIIPEVISALNPEYKKDDIDNIGENAATPFAMYTAYEKQKDKFSKLQMVFYVLDPHILDEKYYLYTKFEKIFLSYKQWKYLNEVEHSENDYFYPFQTFVQSLQLRIKDRSLTNGFSKLKHKDFKAYKKGDVQKELFGSYKLFPLSIFQLEYLSKLKKEFERKGIKFIMLLTPSYSWANYYQLECNNYDKELIFELNYYLGDSIIKGSFWKKDYNLTYNDFKDDTHLAYSGAIKYTQIIFKNIGKYKNIKPEKIKNLYLYKESKNE